MARSLKASRSCAYAWAAKNETKRVDLNPRQVLAKDLDQHIYTIWEDSDEVYGAPRIIALLAKRTIKANRKTATECVRAMAIEGISLHAFVPVTIIALKKKPTLSDLVGRSFDVGELNRVQFNDITYLRTGEDSLYLCAVRDGHSRRVIYWVMGDTQSVDLVRRVLQMVYMSRGEIPKGLVFRADRGG